MLPISAGGITRIHDVSFHAPAIVIPPPVVEHARRQTHALLQFVDYLNKNVRPRASTKKEKEQLNEAIKKLLLNRVDDVDLGTGNVTLDLAFNAQLEPGVARTRLIPKLKTYFNLFARNGKSPAGYLDEVIGEVKISRRVRRALKEQLAAFLKEHASDPDMSKVLEDQQLCAPGTEVCTALSDRIAQVQQVIASIKGN